MPFLVTSGRLCLSTIASFFGGTTPHCLSEYYRGGGRVPSTKTVTTASRDPASGDYYYFPANSPGLGPALIRLGLARMVWPAGYYFWSSTSSLAGLRGVIWNGVYVGAPPKNSTSWTSGGFTYFRSGSQRGYIPQNPPENTMTFYAVYRTGGGTSSSTVQINTGIPSSGRMCMSQFYGAEKP